MQAIEAQSSILQLSIVLTLLFLTFYLLLSAFSHHRKFPLHRTSIAILIGIIAGLVISHAAPQTYNTLVNLDEFIVFSILFPPMIFAAGYTFQTGVIRQNIKYILTFGLLGTFLSFLVSWGLLNGVNQLNLVKDLNNVNNVRTLTAWEILLLAACLCSIDTISAQQTIPEHRLPRLYSIIFGENVIKDAVTIVLFRAVLHLEKQESASTLVLYWYTIFQVLLNFIILIAGSVFSGIVSAFMATFLTKKLRFISHDDGVTQTGFLFLIGFLQYILTQLLDFSGSISLLLYGILLNHYNTYNLSISGRKTSTNTFIVLSKVCEGLLFLIMGIMVCQGEWLTPKQSHQNMTHSYIFCLCVLVVLVIARFMNVYVLGWLGRVISRRFKGKFNISDDQLQFVFLSGMVRGAIPFVLFTSVEFGSQNGSYDKNQGVVLKTTIIFVIACTSVVLNSLIPLFYKKKKAKLLQHQRKRERKLSDQKQESSKWSQLQERYIKPLLIVDYAARRSSIEESQQQRRKQIEEQMKKAQLQEDSMAKQSDNFSESSSQHHLIN